MAEVPVDENRLFIDVCTRCQFVWFDAGEEESIPKIPRTPSWEETVPPETRQRLAILEVERIRAARELESSDGMPDVWWQWIPGLLGLPIEHGANICRSRPWVTWTLGALIVVVGLATSGDLSAAIEQYGLVPAQAGRLGGLTFVSSFFLHGGVAHLLGNVYFLLIFGDNVEDWLGWKRFLLLIFGASVLGNFAHILADPSSTVPCVGASGGISGILAFYALKFPNVRLKMLFRYLVVIHWLSISARAAFFVWIALQLFGVYAQIAGFSNLSALAHLGGASAGLICYMFYRDD
jgi:membrane associated rhomboid family serine protease